MSSLVENKTEFEMLNEKISEIHTSSENVRKGLFARYAILQQMCTEMKAEIDSLKGCLSKST